MTLSFFPASKDAHHHSPAPHADTQEAQPFVVTTDDAASVFSDTAKELAITRASLLADYFHAERQCFEALYARTGCFSHKGAADRAHINELKAREIHQSLIRSRGEKR